MKAALEVYRAKRNFKETPEPSGARAPTASKTKALSFVIQKHDATRLHYDFRLEADGVLKSWAVPKGPSTNPNEKRLAVQTEDHPLSYAGFEGTIPEGHYGAGQVIVWDEGHYENETYKNGRLIPLGQALEHGHIVVSLHGHKMHGAYSLTRFKTEGAKSQWLMVKMRDRDAEQDDPVAEKPESVLSGRTLSRDQNFNLLKDASKASMPAWIEPMKATLTTKRFSNKDWQFEPKLDGVRCLAFVQNGKVRLLSRRQLAMNETYPEVVDALKKQKLDSFLIDGEIVAFRPNSTVTSFEVLQQRLGIHDAREARASSVKIYFYVFDLLYAKGRDLRAWPLTRRQAALETLIQFGGVLRYTTHVVDQGEAYYAEACRNGWEGLIAKRSDGRYESGRSAEWLKFKCIQEQEFIIGGYSDPEGARDHFGALLLGYYEKKVLRFAGKVGTGFSGAVLQRLAEGLKKLKQHASPFHSVDIPHQGLHWVKPVLVAQIAFAEWTRDGKLRQPRFIGLRVDKEPQEVTREKPTSLGDSHGPQKSRSQSR